MNSIDRNTWKQGSLLAAFVLAAVPACGTGEEDEGDGSTTPTLAPTPEPTIPPQVTGVEQPESVFWDSSSRSWFVSSIGGPAELDVTEKDGDGFISRLGAAGQVESLDWVTGLDAPKGLRAHDGTLYVADIDRIVAIDIEAGEIEASFQVPGAQFLNDVEVSAEGDVYVSDTFGNAIYRLVGNATVALLVQDEALDYPNGLLLEGDRLLIASWGATSGGLLSLDLETLEVTTIASGLGNLDGLEKAGDRFLITDYTGGRLLSVAADGSAMALKDGLTGSADIGFDPEREAIGLPEMGAQRIDFFLLADLR